MNKVQHFKILRSAIMEYKGGYITLGLLVQKIEGLIEVIDEPKFKNSVFESFVSLDEVYAMTRISEEFDFATHGKPVVEEALSDILERISSFEKTIH